MKQTYKAINYEWLTNFTGDPFADAGGYALKEFANNFPDLDILEIIMKATDIYVDRWGAGLHMFYLNSTITQTNYKTAKRKKEETKKYFLNLLIEAIPYKYGCCRIIGKETKLFKAGRDNSMLSGASSFLNFFHKFEAGLLLSKEVIIRMFFVPLASILVYDKMAIITSNQNAVTEYFCKEKVKLNLEKTQFAFALRSKYSNPSNALFAFLDDVIASAKIEKNDSQRLSLTLFHYTNIGPSPFLDIYKLPFSVLNFYRFCTQTQYLKQWNHFIMGNYIKYANHKPNYDINTAIYKETVNEVSLIEKCFFEELQRKESLDMNLCEFGMKKNKEKQDCYIIEKGEFDNWKTKKIYKDWLEKLKEKAKKEKTSQEELDKLKESISTEKGIFELQFNEKQVRFKWINLVYDYLLCEKSIIPLVLRWLDPNKSNQELNFKIIKYYQINIKKMNAKTLELIEKLSDFIIDNNDNIGKAISKIKTSRSFELRSFLIKQIEINYKKENSNPLITITDYVNYLFPDGANWTEIRDLFLICIYQKLHEKDIKVEVDDSEIGNDDENL